MKIYLMSTPCAGKTHFAEHHPRYRGCRVVDFSPINKRARQDASYGDRVAPGTSYFERISAFLHAQPDRTCVLGRYGVEAFASFEGIVLAGVLPPEPQHRDQSHLRRLKDPHTRWADFRHVLEARMKMLAYVRQHQLPLYSSFAEALRDLLPDR